MSPESYIPTTRNSGRTEATPVYDGESVYLHEGNQNLLDLQAARALRRKTEEDRARELESRPSTRRDIAEIWTTNLVRIQSADPSVDVVPLMTVRYASDDQDLSAAA